MSLVVEHSVTVRADPSVIWRVLTEPAQWKTWWKECISAELIGGPRFIESSTLELVVQPRYLKLTFKPVVDLLTEGKTLSLTHRSALSQATVSWQLLPRPDATQVTGRGVFQGPLFFLTRIMQQGHLPQLVLYSNLRSLKKIAERLG